MSNVTLIASLSSFLVIIIILTSLGYLVYTNGIKLPQKWLDFLLSLDFFPQILKDKLIENVEHNAQLLEDIQTLNNELMEDPICPKELRPIDGKCSDNDMEVRKNSAEEDCCFIKEPKQLSLINQLIKNAPSLAQDLAIGIGGRAVIGTVVKNIAGRAGSAKLGRNALKSKGKFFGRKLIKGSKIFKAAARRAGSKISAKLGTAIGKRLMSKISQKIATKILIQTATKVAAKGGAFAAKTGAKLAMGPVGAALLAFDLISLGLDLWDPAGFNDLTSASEVIGMSNEDPKWDDAFYNALRTEGIQLPLITGPLDFMTLSMAQDLEDNIGLIETYESTKFFDNKMEQIIDDVITFLDNDPNIDNMTEEEYENNFSKKYEELIDKIPDDFWLEYTNLLDKDKCAILHGKSVEVEREIDGKKVKVWECSWKKDQCMYWPTPDEVTNIYYKCDSCNNEGDQRLCINCKITSEACDPTTDDKCDVQELYKSYSEWNEEKGQCEMVNDAMRRACDSIPGLKYIKEYTPQQLVNDKIVNNLDQAKNALKKQMCVVKNRRHCKSNGGQWKWDANLGIYDCQIPTDQKVFETIFGTTITRGVKIGAEELARVTEIGVNEAKEWTKGAVEDTEQFFTKGGGAEDALNWTGGAVSDVGDFIVDDAGGKEVYDWAAGSVDDIASTFNSLNFDRLIPF